MTLALRPATVRLLLIAAGVLLGLLTIALMVLPEAHAHGVVLGATKTTLATMKPLSVRWH